MSYSTVYGVFPGEQREPIELAEYRNGWGLAPVIWADLAHRYLGEKSWLLAAAVPTFWSRLNAAALTEAERAVLHMTYDRRYILDADRPRAAAHIDEWQRGRRSPWTGVDHWPALTVLLRDITVVATAIGIQHTSVSENLWTFQYDDDHFAEPFRLPYDWTGSASIYDSARRQRRRRARVPA